LHAKRGTKTQKQHSMLLMGPLPRGRRGEEKVCVPKTWINARRVLENTQKARAVFRITRKGGELGKMGKRGTNPTQVARSLRASRAGGAGQEGDAGRRWGNAGVETRVNSASTVFVIARGVVGRGVKNRHERGPDDLKSDSTGLGCRS